MIVEPFVHEMLPARIVFGPGVSARLADEVSLLGGKKAVVLCTPGQRAGARLAAEKLGGLAAGVIAEAVMHTPVDVTSRVLDDVRRSGADCLVALGGGSAIGLGKAIALRTDFPLIAVPTTYAGSEMTPILGETEGGVKRTQRTLKVLPETVLYDPELTLELPFATSLTSAMNAMAHAVEAMYAQNRSPLMSAMASQGLAALMAAIPRIAGNGTDVEARSLALSGAMACGKCLGEAGMSLHHKLCHILGGSFDLPHAETHSVVLPHVVAYNAPAGSKAGNEIGAALGGADPAEILFGFGREHGAPSSLAAIGFNERSVDLAADLATASPYWNPRPVTREIVLGILTGAVLGNAPRKYH